MDFPNMIGLTGALIAGYAYFPQITHLIEARCSAGISREAFALWFTSSILVTINAVFIGSLVFIVLGAVQISATGIIYVFSTKYKEQVCALHATNTYGA